MQPNSRILQNWEVTSYCLARDTGEVKPLEKPSVDECTAMCIRSMVSVNEEKDLRYSQEAPKLA